MCAATPSPDDEGYWTYEAPVGTNNWQPTGEYTCRGVTNPDDPAVVEPVVTLDDFRRLPLPAADINIQPPNRRTLINIPTNLYTTAARVTLPTTILGQPIRVRATPASFRWTYGDGSTRITASAGGPYPNLSTAHTYYRPGNQTLGLVTVYTGEYSVDGGIWQPIIGTATVATPPATLTVLSATNHLVAEATP